MIDNRAVVQRRIRALAETSIFALSVILATPGFAQCAPDPTGTNGVTTCTGTDTDGIAVTTINSAVTVAAGASVSASSMAAVSINAPASYSNYETVNVSGEVQGNGTAGIALFNGTSNGSAFGTTANLRLMVAAGGSVSGTNAVLLTQSSGNSGGQSIATIDNSGTLSGTSGIALQASNPALGGFSSIINRSGGQIGAISGPVGALNNAGTIDGGSNSAIDVGTVYNSYAGYNSAGWINSGTITSSNSSTTLNNNSTPYLSSNAITNSGTISNTGTGTAISGNGLTINNQAAGTVSAIAGAAIAATSSLTLNNAGSIVGNIVVTGAPNFFASSVIDSTAGIINGNVSLSAGDDIVVARYNGTSTLATGITGTIDAGGGTNSIRIKTTQDTVINTTVDLPAGFQRLQLATTYGKTLTLADGFVAPGTITFFSDFGTGGGAIINDTALTFSGQAITSQIYSGASSFTNRGSIRTTGGSVGMPALALGGVVNFTNGGLIDVVGDGVQTSTNGTTTNTGTIISTGTTLSAFGNNVVNRGTIRSTGGTALVVNGNVGTPATNRGLIEGFSTGVRAGIDLTNTGTIVATSPGGTAVALDAYGSLINLAGGVVGNGNGSAAVTASIFNSTVVNAGTINGSVSLTGVFSGGNQRYIALPGGVLNGNLTLGAGSLLVTDIVNNGPGSFAGITGSVTVGEGSSLRYRVSSNAAAVLGPVGSFQNVSYELTGGATLSLTAPVTRTQALLLAGMGTVNLNATIATTSTAAIQTTSNISYAGSPSTGSQLAINNSGSISLTRAANSYPQGAVVLGSGDSFTNSGTVTVVDRQSTGSSVAAVSNGKLVTNTGSIVLDGATGISGAVSITNTGTITQAANGLTSQGIVQGLIVANSGTISVAGTAVQIAYPTIYSPDIYTIPPSITNSGTIAGAIGVAVTNNVATRLDNSGTISGTGGTAVRFGSLNDTVTLQTGSNVIGVIDGGGGADTAILIGTQNTATSSQTVATFNRFSTLTVANGYWTAPATGGSSFSNGITIASGATLEDANGASGLAGATASSIVTNGTLVVRSSAASAGSTFGTTRVTGSGNVLLTGAGTVLLDRVNSLAQTGGTTIADGTTAILTGSQGGVFATASGGTLQIGTGSTTGSFTGSLVDNGALVLNRSDDYTLAGAISGSGSITKLGAGTVTLAGAYSFTGVTSIQGGSIKLGTAAAASSQLGLEGAGQFDLSGLNQTVAGLSGTSQAASLNIAGGALTVNQSGNTSFAGTIIGNGGFTKSGSGRLVMTGNQTYSGPTTVSGGTLSINGSLVSPVTVGNGGTLGGIGTVGTVLIAAGGTYAPGNSIGTQTVTGNVTFAPGSTYLVEANAAGQADRINAGGTATLAGKVAVLADGSGTYANLTSYQILTAAGGITGKFDSVSSNLAFLTPSLIYGTNDVGLLLVRNDVSFSAIAADRNQASVANAIQPLGLGNPIYNAILGRSTEGARRAFASLTGEIHASLPTILLLQSQQVSRIASRHATDEGDGISVWGEALYDRIEGSTGAGIGQALSDQKGGLAGIDIGRNGLRAGVAGGYIDGDLGLIGRASHADIESKLALFYAAWSHDALKIDGGAGYSWHDLKSRRSVDLGALGGAQNAHYKANVVQIYGKASYSIPIGGAWIAPFVGLSYLRMHRDGFAETGSSVALTVARSNRSIEVASAGALLSGEIALGETSLLPRLSLSYQHNWGEVAGIEHATFGGSSSFGIVGTGLGKNALRVEGGAEWRLGKALSLGADTFGETSGGYGQYGARGSIRYQF